MSKKRIHQPYTAFKRALAGKGIVYKEITRLLGVSESAVQLKINGYSDFFIGEQHLICSTYGIDPDIFFIQVVA